MIMINYFNNIYCPIVMTFTLVVSYPGASTFDTRSRRQDDDAAWPNVIRQREYELGLQIDDYCTKHCSKVIVELICNTTTNRCQCHPDFPVNVNNIVCLKSAKIDEDCERNEECNHNDKNSICKENTCVCLGSHVKTISNNLAHCQKASSVFAAGSILWIILCAIGSLILLAFLAFILAKLYRRNMRKNFPRHYAGNGNNSCAVNEAGSRRNSQCSLKSQTSSRELRSKRGIRNNYSSPTQERGIRNNYSSPPPETSMFVREDDLHDKHQEGGVESSILERCKCQNHHARYYHHRNNHHHYHHHHEYM